MIVEAETERMKNFAEFLRSEDKIIFEDMMNQCKLYASYASTLASPIKEVPLLISILFAHHKMLWEHEKQLTRTKPHAAPPTTDANRLANPLHTNPSTLGTTDSEV